MTRIGIVGAGFSGAVLAHEFAKSGIEVDVFESRDHIGGNCYTEVDRQSGIIIHRYGPHIFHTENKKVWEYVNSFTRFMPYINRVKTTVGGQVYSLPVNLHTINQLYAKALSPSEAREFITTIAHSDIADPISFEDQALKFIGKDLYSAFFEGYTKKQWGRNPSELPASILKRLPVRFDYNDNYFSHPYQGMPEYGYTPIFEKLLDHKNIHLQLNSPFERHLSNTYDYLFYSGPIDSYFNYELGRLPYRTLDFVREEHDGDYQGCAVMNYGDLEVPWTRISEHKHFSPWRNSEKTIIFKEFSRECGVEDTPYYPIRQLEEKQLLKRYIHEAEMEKNVAFIGRLGTYRYLDMDITISEALNVFERSLDLIKKKSDLPSFFINPV